METTCKSCERENSPYTGNLVSRHEKNEQQFVDGTPGDPYVFHPECCPHDEMQSGQCGQCGLEIGGEE